EDQRLARAARQLEVDLGVRARVELARVVVDVDLHQQGAEGGVDGVRGADDLAGEASARELGDREGRGHARDGGPRVDLRHVHVDAQHLVGGEVKKLAARAGVDQRADVDVARGDDAVEGGEHVLEAGQLAEPPDVGLRRGDLV